MKKLTISGGNNTSQLFIGEDYQNFKKYLPQKGQVIVLTDEKVRKLYGEAFKEYPIISIGQTEQIKTLETIDAIIDQLISFKADRTSFLLAVGGGIVCDIVGFAASIYQRGIRFGFISTTLLSQVDASVGGKNGVNHRGFKNMIGVFNQPDFVICDPKMLQTLGTEELSCGFAEIVKHTLIADKAVFEWLEKNYTKAIALHPDAIEALVSNSVEIKATIVNKDEKEQGERKKLNLGHTYGHAVEKVMGVPHGYAVSIGLVFAARLSLQMGFLSGTDFQRICSLLKNLNLPITINSKKEEVLNALTMDKKKEGDIIQFILMKGLGEAVIHPMKISDLQSVEF